ncbi:MAG: hypothetical protein K2Q21_08990 [Chitinophagaceae bacterium]|nr:hypothetical protein [Chitinophagaceae bacterium]
MKEKLPQYEGNVHLMKSTYEKLVVLNEDFSITDIPDHHLNAPVEVFSWVEILSDKELKEIKQTILALFREKVSKQCVASKEDLILTKEKIENYTPVQKA